MVDPPRSRGALRGIIDGDGSWIHSLFLDTTRRFGDRLPEGLNGDDSISFEDDLLQALKQPLVERYLALAERESKAHMPFGSITASRGIRIVYEKNADRTHPGRNAREPLAS